MKLLSSKHYDRNYFEWHSTVGDFGGWANQTKFLEYIEPNHTVLDFGCGGGQLLAGLHCAKKLGVEVNLAAIKTAQENGVDVFTTVAQIPNDAVDVIISNNALEHTLHPLEELQSLRAKLRPGGKIVFVVPCEAISYRWNPDDMNHHLYSWSPMCIANLFTEAGFRVIESRPYIHKWPPMYRLLAAIGGRGLFDIVCRLYGRLERSWFQVRIVAEKSRTERCGTNRPFESRLRPTSDEGCSSDHC